MWQKLIQFKREKAAERYRIVCHVKLHNLYSNLILLAFDISLHTVVGFNYAIFWDMFTTRVVQYVSLISTDLVSFLFN
jgi:hypothetical protein